MHSFFVTGTDTGVGKTVVTSAVLAAARKRGLSVACMKPVESGVRDDGESDAGALAAAAGVPVQQAAFYRFAAPVAPGVAAEREGTVIDLERIWDRLQALEAGQPDLLVVEGAGGLLVPLGGGRMMADLIRELALPLIVVARDGLGTINHTLLTVEVAVSRGLPIAGIVLSRTTRDPQPSQENLREIERALGGDPPVLAIVPYLQDRSTASLASAGDPIVARLLS